MIENVDVVSFGWWYEIILVLLSLVVIVDSVSIIKTMSGELEDKREYAELCVKYLKLLMCVMAGGFFLLIAFTYGYDTVTSVIHGILGGLLILDALVSLVIKLIYGRRHR